MGPHGRSKTGIPRSTEGGWMLALEVHPATYISGHFDRSVVYAIIGLMIVALTGGQAAAKPLSPSISAKYSPSARPGR